ncbi:MAG: RHS repeat-associated core domain-containing protein [Burkholderiales bacterium]|nr:RHS repeat-associated core domain-containing protein [Burkholderiales bacterium]
MEPFGSHLEELHLRRGRQPHGERRGDLHLRRARADEAGGLGHVPGERPGAAGEEDGGRADPLRLRRGGAAPRRIRRGSAAIQEYVWLGDLPVAVLRPALPGGFTAYYVWADHLGTPRVVSDAANVVRWEWANANPFGAHAPDDNPSGAGAFAFNLRFPGQYFDQETGLHYNYFRDYDPGIGRYVQSDPIGLVGGVNTYGYVSAQPLRFGDRRGLAADCPGCRGQGPSDDACCGHPNAMAGLAGIGGTVMCCAGRKASCSNVAGPEPGKSALRKCVMRHEDRHLPDTMCLDCFSVHRAVFRPGISQSSGECAAYKVELECLRESGPQCGNDGACLDWIRSTLSHKLDFGNMFFNCGFMR